jgi:hypothetical protein
MRPRFAATVKGFEAGFQVPFHSVFHELPVVLRDMGVLANYTIVDAKSGYDFFGNTVQERLLGLSNGSYKATRYYDDSAHASRSRLAAAI